ncbi:methylated-DNA--[protein]-cysteine S-methyltransferase [Ferrimonas sediminicola]|uniref:Methylated-DNA--protein-cysteine methyltransferase n=1 Tax=Ferrimonas sediminicola TaxID=2569538 RepID=A0A4U1BIG5_9GAMM|nr:methylated-DNA--[protein]-cysteine S-methyltransferase [Ferrimonas sediminicola]TKB51250.1 methylated-DNA--[protein]-cysteine S-methyltransferase [Ferrimonas sediminicola]
MKYDTWDSPWGEILAAVSDRGLALLAFQQGTQPATPPPEWHRDREALAEVRRQCREYAEGRRSTFELPLDMTGTEFQRQVWQALTTIPAGATRSYGEIARQIGRPKAVRAVGAANGRNPVALVVPCHRVIGASGSLTGYAGGVDLKAALLRHEQRLA